MNQRKDQRDEIERALIGYQAAAVAGIAAALGIDRARFPRKNDQVGEVARRLAEGEGLAEQIAALSEAQRAALAFVVRRGTLVPLRSVTTLLRRYLGTQEAAAEALQEVLRRGLMLFGVGVGTWKLDLSSHDPTLPTRQVWSPRSIVGLLATETAWTDAVERIAQPSTVKAGDPGDLLRDIYLLLRSLRARLLRLTQQGAPHQSDLRRLVAEMRPHLSKKDWEDGADEVLFLIGLAHGASLIIADLDGLRPAPAVEEFLASSRSSQVARLHAAWLVNDWSELAMVPGLILDGYTGGYGDVPDTGRLTAARRLIQEALAALSDGAWWSVDGIGAAIRRRDPDFLTGGATTFGLMTGGWAYWSPYAAQPSDVYRGIRRAGVSDYRESQLSKETDWDLVEGAYLRQVIADQLCWLGLVDAGLGVDGRVLGVRVTPLGQTVLTGQPAAAAVAPSGPRLVVQPNFELIVLDTSTSLDLMGRLDAFATSRTVDRAAIYHLTRDGVVAALQRGRTLAEIEQLLETESGGPLPQNVAYSLAEWARQFERVTVRTGAMLLEADHPDQLERWLADPVLGRLLGRRLGPALMLVPAEAVWAVEERLKRQTGWRSVSAGPAPAGALTACADGLILRSDATNRFEVHRIGSFAELVRTERTGHLYRLTAASVEKGRVAGWSADKLLGLLRTRLGGEPPAELVLKVRGWLGEYAPAQQATVRLVRLPDPLLWRLIEPLAASGGLVVRVGTAVVLVDEVALARVAEALAGAGVRLEATTPETAAVPLLAAGRTGVAPGAPGLQTLRGKALRDFLTTAAHAKQRVTIVHQASNQKSPRRWTVTPRWVEQRMSGYHLAATVDGGVERSFKLDDIFGVALEEAT